VRPQFDTTRCAIAFFISTESQQDHACHVKPPEKHEVPEVFVARHDDSAIVVRLREQFPVSHPWSEQASVEAVQSD